MSTLETAEQFFKACETGEGWAGCQHFCTADATFTAQGPVLADVTSLSAYAEWMKGLLVSIPDGAYDLKFFAEDQVRGRVVAVAQFTGTQSGPGPVDPPTGNSVAADYAYAMEFSGDKISHMTKIWNDGDAVAQLGWG